MGTAYLLLENLWHFFGGYHLVRLLFELHQSQPSFFPLLLFLKQVTAGEILFSLQINFPCPVLLSLYERQMSGSEVYGMGRNQVCLLNTFLFLSFLSYSLYTCFLKVSYLRPKEESAFLCDIADPI